MRALVLAVFVMCAPPVAQAQGGVRVSPIMLALGEDARTTSFRMQNLGERARAFQIDVMAWRQDDGVDVLAPTTELIVSPGVFEVQAGRTQIVRAALAAHVGAVDAEQTYRLLLREFALEDAPAARGLQLRLEISLPVFVRGRAADAPMIVAMRAGDEIEIVNRGAAHVRLSDVRVGDTALDAPRYLLAGASFRRPAPAGPVRARVGHGNAAFAELMLSDAAPELRGR